jgi:hypothetical protein
VSRQRKAAVVLRLLGGEDLETVSRGLGVTAAAYRDAFMAAGEGADHEIHDGRGIGERPARLRCARRPHLTAAGAPADAGERTAGSNTSRFAAWTEGA